MLLVYHCTKVVQERWG